MSRPSREAPSLPRRPLLLGGLAALALAAPAIVRAAPVTPGVLPRVMQFPLHAGGDKDRPHRILAAWPQGDPPQEGFPVLYVLDGDALFTPTVQLLRQQTRLRVRSQPNVAHAVVVGIGYPGETNRRDQDYTPPAPDSPPGTGGGEGFLGFIQQQLMPAIGLQFSIDPSRQAIFGHSYGGLLVLHALFTRPGLFHRHVAVSPSIGWGNGAILASEAAFRDHPPPEASRLGLMLALGALEGPARPGLSEGERNAWAERHPQGGAREMAQRLAALGPHGPQVEFVSFDDLDHQSVVEPAIARSLRFALPME